jgi:hypothetical protein
MPSRTDRIVFGAYAPANLTALGYTLRDRLGNIIQSRQVTVAEAIESEPGTYIATADIPTGFLGEIKWDTGTVNPRYSFDYIDIAQGNTSPIFPIASSGGYFTFGDAVEHALNWLGSSALNADRDRSDARRAAIAGLRSLGEAHPWTHYVTLGRINTVSPFGTGTIRFQVSGGSAPNLVTLSGGTWPSWAPGASLRIGERLYPVAQSLSGTTLILAGDTSPLEDVPAGTTFKLFQDTYALPADWRQADVGISERHFSDLTYVAPQNWLRWVRSYQDAANPCVYTVTTDVRYPGRYVARLWPIPQEARTIDYVYRRSPRPLRFQGVREGTVSVTSGSNILTGIGTRFRREHVGSVVRITDPVAPTPGATPTAEWGLNPYVHETRIMTATNLVSVVMEASAPVTGSRLGYIISDPVDINAAAMLTAYQRAIEWQMSLLRSMTDKPNPRAAWDRALTEAMAADNVYSGPMVVREVPVGNGDSRFLRGIYYGKIDFGGG